MDKFIFLILCNITIIGSISLYFYKSWLDFFRPDWFYIFNIYEHNLLNFKEHKIFLPLSKEKDSYIFDKCDYDKSASKPYINPKGVYIWHFIKGQNKPINFNIQNSTDGMLIAGLKKSGQQAIDDIVAGEPTLEDFLKTWGIVILGIILIVGFVYVMQQNNTTTQILINLTRSK